MQVLAAGLRSATSLSVLLLGADAMCSDALAEAIAALPLTELRAGGAAMGRCLAKLQQLTGLLLASGNADECIGTPQLAHNISMTTSLRSLSIEQAGRWADFADISFAHMPSLEDVALLGFGSDSSTDGVPLDALAADMHGASDNTESLKGLRSLVRLTALTTLCLGAAQGTPTSEFVFCLAQVLRKLPGLTHIHLLTESWVHADFDRMLEAWSCMPALADLAFTENAFSRTPDISVLTQVRSLCLRCHVGDDTPAFALHLSGLTQLTALVVRQVDSRRDALSYTLVIGMTGLRCLCDLEMSNLGLLYSTRGRKGVFSMTTLTRLVLDHCLVSSEWDRASTAHVTLPAPRHVTIWGCTFSSHEVVGPLALAAALLTQSRLVEACLVVYTQDVKAVLQHTRHSFVVRVVWCLDGADQDKACRDTDEFNVEMQDQKWVEVEHDLE